MWTCLCMSGEFQESAAYIIKRRDNKRSLDIKSEFTDERSTCNLPIGWWWWWWSDSEAPNEWTRTSVRDQVKGGCESFKEVTEQDIQAHRMEKVRGCCPPKNNSFTMSAVVPTSDWLESPTIQPFSCPGGIQVLLLLPLPLRPTFEYKQRSGGVSLCSNISCWSSSHGVYCSTLWIKEFDSYYSQVHHRPRRTGRISFAAYNCMLFFPLIMTFWPQSNATRRDTSNASITLDSGETVGLLVRLVGN